MKDGVLKKKLIFAPSQLSPDGGSGELEEGEGESERVRR